MSIKFVFGLLFLKPKTYCGAAQEKESKVASVSLGLLGSSVAADTTILPLDGGRAAPDPPAVDPRLSPPRHRHPPHRRPCLRPGNQPPLFLSSSICPFPALHTCLFLSGLLDLQISHRQATASWPGAEKQGPLIREFACSITGDLLLHFVVRLVFCENCIRSFGHFVYVVKLG